MASETKNDLIAISVEFSRHKRRRTGLHGVVRSEWLSRLSTEDCMLTDERNDRIGRLLPAILRIQGRENRLKSEHDEHAYTEANAAMSGSRLCGRVDQCSETDQRWM
jgi:hypothetical protein